MQMWTSAALAAVVVAGMVPNAAALSAISPATAAYAGSVQNLNAQGKVLLKGLTLPEMEASLSLIGESRSRAGQLAAWMYRDGRLVTSVDQCQGSFRKPHYNIPNESRRLIDAHFDVNGGLELQKVLLSKDGTRKMIHDLTSGQGIGGQVETVIIPMLQGPQKSARYTVCVSSQVGCAMACRHCFTGTQGIRGQLQTAQIVEQVVAAKRHLEEVGDKTPITGAVFMGQGEPFDNYDNVMRAVNILTNPAAGPRLSARRVTVSTVGLIPEIVKFCSDKTNRAQLAVSLHSADDSTRSSVLPTNRRYPLAELISTLKTFFPSPISGSGNNSDERKLVQLQYTLLKGVNDSVDDARKLVELTEGLRCVINLITMNPWIEDTPFQPVAPVDAEVFRAEVAKSGRICTFRDSKGDDEMSACGQLGRGRTAS
jgi:23S rRNA (adenine2503-C2)-methyltransferase